MLAFAVVAGDANWPVGTVDDDDRVEPVGFAGATVVFDGFAGAEGASHYRYCASEGQADLKVGLYDYDVTIPPCDDCGQALPPLPSC